MPSSSSNSPPPAVALRGAVLTPTTDGGVRFERDGAVLVGADGRLLRVGKASAVRRRYRGMVRDLRGALIVPGLVDTHVHYPQTRIIGQATGPLLRWLETSVFPEEARLAKKAYAEAVAHEMAERFVTMGTTTAAIFSSSSAKATDTLFRVLDRWRLRAQIGLCFMDARTPKTLKVERKAALRDAERLIDRWHGHDGRLGFAVTPRFALSCSRRMLEDAGALAAAHGLLVQTHIGETKEEGRQTAKAFPDAKHYVDVYERAGLMTERTILAHAIHLTAAEWRRVVATGASVAHCPDSNFFLGSGRMKAKAALKRGITVALGSDVAAGRSFSMRRAMSYAYDNALCVDDALTPAEVFRMATLEGARALGLADRVGSLEEGKEADIAVFDLPRPPQTAEEALASLVFDTDRPQAREVYVRGERLDDGTRRDVAASLAVAKSRR